MSYNSRLQSVLKAGRGRNLPTLLASLCLPSQRIPCSSMHGWMLTDEGHGGVRPFSSTPGSGRLESALVRLLLLQLFLKESSFKRLLECGFVLLSSRTPKPSTPAFFLPSPGPCNICKQTIFFFLYMIKQYLPKFITCKEPRTCGVGVYVGVDIHICLLVCSRAHWRERKECG